MPAIRPAAPLVVLVAVANGFGPTVCDRLRLALAVLLVALFPTALRTPTRPPASAATGVLVRGPAAAPTPSPAP
ncbi:hypothetical protein ACWGLF_27440 [Streptomyces puniciscabiei]